MSSLKQPNIIEDITKEGPFDNCKLGREKYAHILNNIFSHYGDGFVMALDNPWGTGKTTFVLMWQKLLEKNEFHTIYFNAWENDINNEPFVALLAELKTFVNQGNETKFIKVLEKFALISKAVIPAAAKGLAKRYLETDSIVETIEGGTKGVLEVLQRDIEKYAKRKEDLKAFRIELAQFIHEISPDKPVIFFIDELDRCKPSYSVEILEHIKHFFSVDGITFVLSIDKEQLKHAIGGYYGSESLNTEEYLRRFIDFSYSLPEPSTEDYCNFLYDYFDFKSFFEVREGSNSDVSGGSKKFREFAIDLFELKKLTLRQQEKFLAQTRVILKTFTKTDYIFPSVLIYLIYIKNFWPSTYKGIRDMSLSLNDFMLQTSEVIAGDSLGEWRAQDYIYAQAQMLTMYNNRLKHDSQHKTTLYTKHNNGNFTSPFKSSLESSNGPYFIQCLHNIGENRSSGKISINFLLDRIDIMEPIES